ncbi:nicotinate phosphoribosyltransferase [Saccharopolyspora phatthalungensis]|uniref:Nicotinate phosphoribosyltransferase n=2 Tax=Saccharopolyspora phatthalungensis TaxID=664693 RepID=A0A840QCF8_9PSEU|nr:nicotinate phosphoribosyltransferase [Saccharopolyspora phatthalungensis]
MTGLCTDLYEIRMAASYLRRGMTAPATFSLFARKLPRERGFLVAAGLADCLDFLERLHFGADELAYLGDVVHLPHGDLAALGNMRFTGDVWAVPEGRVVFAGQPFLEVTAPLPQAQLVETALLNFVTFQSSVAAKAARCRLAAPQADLVDFAARRTHGLEAARAVARASAITGFTGTSYVAAAREFGLQAVGTMAHSYIEAFPDESTAFRAFADDFPDATVFLVDTYDTLHGVCTAIEVAQDLPVGSQIGIRLDSGDLGDLAVQARRLLDDAGLTSARIMASGGFDEHALAELAEAPIDLFGVGTRMGVSADAPSLDSAYKLVEYD